MCRRVEDVVHSASLLASERVLNKNHEKKRARVRENREEFSRNNFYFFPSTRQGSPYQIFFVFLTFIFTPHARGKRREDRERTLTHSRSAQKKNDAKEMLCASYHNASLNTINRTMMKTTSSCSSSSSSSSSLASSHRTMMSAQHQRRQPKGMMKARSSFLSRQRNQKTTTTSTLAREEQRRRKSIISAATTTSTSELLERDEEEKEKESKVQKSSLFALGAVTALCAVGGSAVLLNPSEAFAMTTTTSQHVLELAESNADALDPETAKTIASILGPLFAVSEILFIVRIVMTWYPSVPITKLPWVVAYVPTEPLLKPTRSAIPPVGGVDVSPIIWVGMISFLNEILLGKQGLLVLLSNKTMA